MCSLPLGAEDFDGAKLKLLDGALAPSELLGNFANALLFDEAHVNYAKLCLRKPVHKFKQDGLTLYVARIRVGQLRFESEFLPAGFLEMVCHRARRDPQEPGGEGHSTPLKTTNARERFPENVRSQVLRDVATSNAA